MNHRERLLATFRHTPVDRGVDWEFGAWDEAIKRWHGEGLPEQFTGEDAAVDEYFGCDNVAYGPQPGMRSSLFPTFKARVLEEHDDKFIVQDAEGVISEQGREIISIPRYLKYPIESRADWERLRDERLDPAYPGRLPENLGDLIGRLQAPEYPVMLFVGSLYGWLRNWMGVEGISLAVYDDPAWVEEMIEHLTRLNLKLLEAYAGKITIDVGLWWEDMCYNKGPLLGPRQFGEWLVPRYRRITEFMRRECGTEFHVLDCDGNIHELAGLWLEGGINVMFPLEALHTDALELSRQYGRRMALRGGFNKMALIAGPAAIDRELERLRPLYARGGFIPHTDHRAPPDVSWANYCYYRQKKCELLGKSAWRA